MQHKVLWCHTVHSAQQNTQGGHRGLGAPVLFASGVVNSLVIQCVVATLDSLTLHGFMLKVPQGTLGYSHRCYKNVTSLPCKDCQPQLFWQCTTIVSFSIYLQAAVHV